MVADNIHKIKEVDTRMSEDEVALNMSLQQCEEFGQRMHQTHKTGPPKSIVKLLEQLQEEVARLSAKVEKSQAGRMHADLHLVQSIEKAFDLRVNGGLGYDGVITVQTSQSFGAECKGDQTYSYPRDEKALCSMAWEEIPQVKTIQWDIGSHLRCMEWIMSDGTSTDKVGSYLVEKVQSFLGNAEIRRIEGYERLPSNDIGSIHFYNGQEEKLLSFGLNLAECKSNFTELIIEPNQKIIGFEASHGMVVNSLRLKLASIN